MKKCAERFGSAYIIVLVFAGILLIFMAMFSRVRSGAIGLLSRSAKDFLATTIGEAGINCVLSELRVNNDYHTHDLYKMNAEDPWETATAQELSSLANTADLKLYGIKKGIYSGETRFGQFKVKFAKIFGKDDVKTQTLKEGMMYLRAEAMVHVGESKNADEDSFRHIVCLLEKRSPISEFLLFDGEYLDLGQGPYEPVPNIASRGRLYGYQHLSFSTVGPNDKGTSLLDMEKIESPGIIRVAKDTPIAFSNKKNTVLNSSNDSSVYNSFKVNGGYILDGAHGAHPIKLTQLPKEYFLEKVKRKNSGGFIIEKGTFPVSPYKNPYDLTAEYVDLDFGEFHLGQSEPDDGEDPGEDPPDSPSDPPYGTDDPGDLKITRGKKLMVYSKVPLRIWGCPDRTISIYSEKDIVVAGDFNQNPITVQDYPDKNCLDYKTNIKNGKAFNKCGALIMSEGRVFIDVSRPSLFSKNEIKPFFMYQLAMTLEPNFYVYPDIASETKTLLCPLLPKDGHGGIVGTEQPDGSGTAKIKFGLIAWLMSHSTTDVEWANRMSGPTNFFTPGVSATAHFGIRDEQKRKEIILKLDSSLRNGGDLSAAEFDDIFKIAWEQAQIEEKENPTADCGAMGIMNALYDEAAKDVKDGIWMPEITINASLVSCTRRFSSFKVGPVGAAITTPLKTFDEIGNAPANDQKIVEYLTKPRRLIQRVYGSEIRLASEEPTYFVSGKYTGVNVIRRRLWDRSLSGGKYQPKLLPFAFNILTYRDQVATKKEFESF